MAATIAISTTEQEVKKPYSKCGKEKRLNEFGPHSKGRYGRQAACLKRENARRREYKHTHPHIVKADRVRTEQRRKERCEYDSALRDKRRETGKRAWRKRAYGLSHVEYLTMLKAQNGVCAICSKPETVRNQWGVIALAIDHNHVTGAV